MTEAHLPPAPLYQKRIAYTANILRLTLRLAGAILLIVQIVKALIAGFEGDNFITLSIVSASGLAILAIAVSTYSLMKGAVTKLAAQLRPVNTGLSVYLSALLLSGLILLIKIAVGPASEQWRLMSSEGGLSEYGTAIAYLLIPFFSYPTAKQFRRQGNRLGIEKRRQQQLCGKNRSKDVVFHCDDSGAGW